MRNRFDILVIAFIIIVLNISLFVFGYNYKISYYKTIDMIYISDNKYDLLVDENLYNLIKNNKTIYIDNYKYNYKINNYNKNIIHRNNKYYHNIIIEINKENNYKTNDIIIGSILYKKIRLISIFRSIYNC